MQSSQEIVRHWILSLAVEGRRRLSDFVPYVEEEHLNVRKIPGVSGSEYAATFLELYSSCSIRLGPLSDDEHESALTHSDLGSVLEACLLLPPISRRTRLGKTQTGTLHTLAPASPDLWWELTLRGGEEWEALAEPNWERYVEILTDQDSGEGWSANLDALMAELGWCRELNGVEIDRQTLGIEKLIDHQITYWKVLPFVYHARFRGKWVEDHWLTTAATELKWFQEWWHSRCDWCTKPWTLPIWPTAEGIRESGAGGG